MCNKIGVELSTAIAVELEKQAFDTLTKITKLIISLRNMNNA